MSQGRITAEYRLKQKRDLVPLTVYLPPAVLEELERKAKAAERTTSAEARRRLVASLAEKQPRHLVT